MNFCFWDILIDYTNGNIPREAYFYDCIWNSFWKYDYELGEMQCVVESKCCEKDICDFDYFISVNNYIIIAPCHDAKFMIYNRYNGSVNYISFDDIDNMARCTIMSRYENGFYFYSNGTKKIYYFSVKNMLATVIDNNNDEYSGEFRFGNCWSDESSCYIILNDKFSIMKLNYCTNEKEILKIDTKFELYDLCEVNGVIWLTTVDGRVMTWQYNKGITFERKLNDDVSYKIGRYNGHILLIAEGKELPWIIIDDGKNILEVNPMFGDNNEFIEGCSCWSVIMQSIELLVVFSNGYFWKHNSSVDVFDSMKIDSASEKLSQVAKPSIVMEGLIGLEDFINYI